MKDENIKTPFNDGRPGRSWYDGFMKRHLELSERVAQNLTLTRAKATPEKLKAWFKNVQTYLESIDLKNIEPNRCFNLDESCFLMAPKSHQVIARRGMKSVYKIINGNEKENATVLFNLNAKGDLAPAMIIFPYTRIPRVIVEKIPRDWSVGRTDSGWMTSDTFFSYMRDVFHPWVVSQGIQFPIVVYMDGHSSHITLPLVLFCRKNSIELIALYPNATHLL